LELGLRDEGRQCFSTATASAVVDVRVRHQHEWLDLSAVTRAAGLFKGVMIRIRCLRRPARPSVLN
jgi:hypothetical protein